MVSLISRCHQMASIPDLSSRHECSGRHITRTPPAPGLSTDLAMVASAASIARPSRLLVLVLGLVTNTRGLGPAYAGDKFVRFKVGKETPWPRASFEPFCRKSQKYILQTFS